MTITIIEKITLCAKKSIPPSFGSSVCAATAENVVKPAQKPGKRKCRSVLFPRRSIKTRSPAASATPIKFAAKTPLRVSGIAIPSPYRTNVPAIPPIETRTSDFRGVGLSL